MSDPRFRKPPYIDVGIDGMKMALIAILFLLLAVWALIRFI